MIQIPDIRIDMNTALMIQIPDIRVDMNTALEAFEELFAMMPPLSQIDILLISLNPSLNWFQRRNLIKEIRKGMKK